MPHPPCPRVHTTVAFALSVVTIAGCGAASTAPSTTTSRHTVRGSIVFEQGPTGTKFARPPIVSFDRYGVPTLAAGLQPDPLTATESLTVRSGTGEYVEANPRMKARYRIQNWSGTIVTHNTWTAPGARPETVTSYVLDNAVLGGLHRRGEMLEVVLPVSRSNEHFSGSVVILVEVA